MIVLVLESRKAKKYDWTEFEYEDDDEYENDDEYDLEL
jgi:hypothetical protein